MFDITILVQKNVCSIKLQGTWILTAKIAAGTNAHKAASTSVTTGVTFG